MLYKIWYMTWKPRLYNTDIFVMLKYLYYITKKYVMIQHIPTFQLTREAFGSFVLRAGQRAWNFSSCYAGGPGTVRAAGAAAGPGRPGSRKPGARATGTGRWLGLEVRTLRIPTVTWTCQWLSPGNWVHRAIQVPC